MANYRYFQTDAYEYNLQVRSLRTGALTVIQTYIKKQSIYIPVCSVFLLILVFQCHYRIHE